MDEAAPIYGIDELAERASVSRRTVRYYVQRGLLPAPAGVGRGKHYSAAHLRTLIAIKELQEAEVSLDDIHARLHGSERSTLEPRPEPRMESSRQVSWTRVAIADGVELHLRGRRLSEAHLAAVSRAIVAVIGSEIGGEDHEQ